MNINLYRIKFNIKLYRTKKHFSEKSQRYKLAHKMKDLIEYSLQGTERSLESQIWDQEIAESIKKKDNSVQETSKARSHKRQSLELIMIQNQDRIFNQARQRIERVKQRKATFLQQTASFNYLLKKKQLILVNKLQIQSAQSKCIDYFKQVLKQVQTQFIYNQNLLQKEPKFTLQNKFAQFIDEKMQEATSFIESCFQFQNLGTVAEKNQQNSQIYLNEKPTRSISNRKNNSIFIPQKRENLANQYKVQQVKSISKDYELKNQQLQKQLQQRQRQISQLQKRLKMTQKYSSTESQNFVKKNSKILKQTHLYLLKRSQSSHAKSSSHQTDSPNSFKLNMLNFEMQETIHKPQLSQYSKSPARKLSKKSDKQKQSKVDKQNCQKNVNMRQVLQKMKKTKLKNVLECGKTLENSNSALINRFYRKKFNL